MPRAAAAATGASTRYGPSHPRQSAATVTARLGNALVGFGRITERPWAASGMLGVRPVVTTTLAAGRRATDGIAGARFLAHIDSLLQEPEQL